MLELEEYIDHAIDLGCPVDQLANFARVGITLQERQLLASTAARSCDKPDGPFAIGYGGARGGGKSHWLLAQMGADDCQRVAGLKCLLLRKVGKANLENFEDLRRRLFKHLLHEFSPSRGLLTFANGSRIILGHFQNEKDIDGYLGLEYDVIGIEEATTLTQRKHTDITTCCRTSRLDWRPRMYSTTNPGGVGHGWYRQKFITPWERREEKETRFIPARVTDNRFTNVDYIQVLQNLTGWQRRAWFEGDWTISAGQYFTTFRRDAHVIDDFDVDRAKQWFCAMDYGFAHYTAVLLGCNDHQGNIYIIDEHAERFWVPQRHVAAIRIMLGRHNVLIDELSRFVAGSDVFARQSDGTSVADQYRKHGVRLTPANMDRTNGWGEILGRLGDPAMKIKPTLFIHSRCKRLLETLPDLQHDPNRPEDVLKTDTDDDGIGGDDLVDALRYLVATKPREIHVVRLIGF
jgi:phage terminase large subunit